MRTSEEGRALIRRFEGLRTGAYRDAAGVWTIGYGHAGPAARPGAEVTEAEAERLFRADLARFEAGVARRLRVPVSQAQFDALVSLAYNIGLDAFARSTALARLNAGDPAGAAAAIGWWDKATIGGEKRVLRGLTRRRAAETALFLRGAMPRPAPAPARARRPGRIAPRLPWRPHLGRLTGGWRPPR